MDTDSDILDLFRERVAIMVIDGEQDDCVAIKHAYFECRRVFGKVEFPKEITDAYRRCIAPLA